MSHKTKQCPKHKTYQGLRETKRDCPECKRLFKAVQKSIAQTFDPAQPYNSLTTPNKCFGILGFITELSCVMLYGNRLPPYFWNTNSKAAYHFKREIQKLQAWKYRDKKLFDAVHTVFYHTYSQYAKEMLAKKVKNKPISKGRPAKIDDEDDDETEAVGLEAFGYDPEEIRRQALGKRYRQSEKEEDQAQEDR